MVVHFPVLVELLDAHSLARDAVALLQQVRGHRTAEDICVSRHMIGMSMGNEGTRLWTAAVEPEIDIAQMQSMSRTEADFTIVRHAETIQLGC